MRYIYMEDKPKLAEDFYKNDPKTIKDIEKMGYKLKYINEGAFRVVYEIVGTGAIVKLPLQIPANTTDQDYKENLAHSAIEIETICKIKKHKKYNPIRDFLPTVYFMNKKTGIIVMKKYKTPRNEKVSVVAQILTLVVNKLFRQGFECDVYSYNIGYDPLYDQYVIIDFGCFAQN